MAAVLPFLSAGVNAFSSLAQGRASAQQYYGQSMADDYNAAIARQKADSVLQVGKYRSGEALALGGMQEEQVRRQNRIEAGEMAASAGQSGTGTGGSNEDVERQHDVLSELDALNVRYGAQLTSHDIEMQAGLEATDYTNTATLDTFYSQQHQRAGKTADTMGKIGAVGALLGGTSKMFGLS